MKPSTRANGSRAGLVALAVIAVVGLACEPGWSVRGTVALGAGVDPAQYSRLVLRAESFDGGFPVPAGEEILEVASGVPQRGGAPAPFPVSFAHGRLGVFFSSGLRISAFLSPSATPAVPMSGDAAASKDLPLPSCGPYFYGYCGAIEGVSLELQPVP